MATSERRERLRAKLDAVEDPDVQSLDELFRRQDRRMAADLGLPSPAWRSLLSLRLHGPGVREHDTPGDVVGPLLTHITRAVAALAAQLHLPPEQGRLYVSPTVRPGSTIVELVGPPVAPISEPHLDDEAIDPNPIDAALRRLVETVEAVPDEPDGPADHEGFRVDRRVGRHLFDLAEELLAANVDLDVTWQAPTGRVRMAPLDQRRAGVLRDLLDRPETQVRRMEGFGVVSSISIDGEVIIKLEPSGRASFKQDELDADSVEMLRDLWANRVRVVWERTTLRRSQRDTNPKTVDQLLHLEAAPALSEG